MERNPLFIEYLHGSPTTSVQAIRKLFGRKEPQRPVFLDIWLLCASLHNIISNVVLGRISYLTQGHGIPTQHLYVILLR